MVVFKVRARCLPAHRRRAVRPTLIPHVSRRAGRSQVSGRRRDSVVRSPRARAVPSSYRKLTGDVQWPVSTPFSTAAGKSLPPAAALPSADETAYCVPTARSAHAQVRSRARSRCSACARTRRTSRSASRRLSRPRSTRAARSGARAAGACFSFMFACSSNQGCGSLTVRWWRACRYALVSYLPAGEPRA